MDIPQIQAMFQERPLHLCFRRCKVKPEKPYPEAEAVMPAERDSVMPPETSKSEMGAVMPVAEMSELDVKEWSEPKPTEEEVMLAEKSVPEVEAAFLVEK